MRTKKQEYLNGFCLKCSIVNCSMRDEDCAYRQVASDSWDAALESYGAELEQVYQKRLSRILGVLKEYQEYCLELAQKNNELRKRNRK